MGVLSSQVHSRMSPFLKVPMGHPVSPLRGPLCLQWRQDSSVATEGSAASHQEVCALPLLVGPGVHNPTLQAQWPWPIWDILTGVRVMETVVTLLPPETDPPGTYHSASGNRNSLVHLQTAPCASALLQTPGCCCRSHCKSTTSLWSQPRPPPPPYLPFPP